MDSCAGKRKLNDNGSNHNQQKRKFGFSTTSQEENIEALLDATIKQNEASSSTTLNNLPLEILDIILQKSYLRWTLNSSTKQREEEVIRSLISVDVCFNRRITRQRFRRAIWRYLTDFYGKTKKRDAIIRNNRNYFVDNIQPSDELIGSLLSLNCITEEQSRLIHRKRSMREKNEELLYVVKYIDKTEFSNFVKCLRHTNQKTVAKIVENGGGVIEIRVQVPRANITMSEESQQLHKKIEDLRSRTNPRSNETDKLIVQLREEGLEILSSQLDRQTVVVWIWCRTQAALEYIQRLHESNILIDIFFAIIQSLTCILKVIDIDRNHFKKTLVVCSISINFTQRIEISLRGNQHLLGLTKLQNDIYILCQSFSSAPTVILIFEDQHPFRLQKKIEIKEIKYPFDIGSSEKEHCLYICDYRGKCVWKITRETDDQYRIIKWLTTNYKPRTLSVSSDGQLLMLNYLSYSLMIYGSDAALIQSIPLPRDIACPRHAVETPIGNFIIIYDEEKKNAVEMAMETAENEEHVEDKIDDDDDEEELMGEVKQRECLLEKGGRRVSCGKRWKVVVSELSRVGQIVVRRFIPSNEAHQLNLYGYLSLDSDDRVFVADKENARVILLDSDLNLNRTLSPTSEGKNTRIRGPWRLCYDKDMKQLIIGDFQGFQVYTLSRN